MQCAAVVTEKVLEEWTWQLKLANPRRSAKLLGQCFSVPFALHDPTAQG